MNNRGLDSEEIMKRVFVCTQNRYYNEYHEGLVELAKGFFKSLKSDSG
jgi:endonuclease III-like uncharacterized protein